MVNPLEETESLCNIDNAIDPLRNEKMGQSKVFVSLMTTAAVFFLSYRLDNYKVPLYQKSLNMFFIFTLIIFVNISIWRSGIELHEGQGARVGYTKGIPSLTADMVPFDCNASVEDNKLSLTEEERNFRHFLFSMGMSGIIAFAWFFIVSELKN